VCFVVSSVRASLNGKLDHTKHKRPTQPEHYRCQNTLLCVNQGNTEPSDGIIRHMCTSTCECVRKREGRVRSSLWYECNPRASLREDLNIDCREFGSLTRLRVGLYSNNELHELGSSLTAYMADHQSQTFLHVQLT